MKKFKGVIAAILPFVYAMLIMFGATIFISFIYGILQGIILAAQGVTNPDEIARKIEEAVKGDFVVFVSLVAALINLLVFSIWYYKKFKNPNPFSFKETFKPKTLFFILILGISLQIGISMILNIAAPIFKNTFDEYEKLLESLGMGSSIISFIYISIVAPFSEEFIFRGVILNKAKKALPFIYANILQAILFAIMHGNIVQGTYAFVIGLFLGFLYEVAGSIYIPVLLHFVINLGGILLGQIPESLLEKYSFIMIIIAILSFAGIVYSSINMKNMDMGNETASL